MTEPQAQSSPLAEASASSLDEFFSRRPPYDEATRMALIRELRRMREKWETSGVGEKVTAKKAKKPAAASTPIDANDLWSAGD